MTTSEIENDQNDLDQNDHVGTTVFKKNCPNIREPQCDCRNFAFVMTGEYPCPSPDVHLCLASR